MRIQKFLFKLYLTSLVAGFLYGAPLPTARAASAARGTVGRSAPAETCDLKDVESLKGLTTALLCQDAYDQRCYNLTIDSSRSGADRFTPTLVFAGTSASNFLIAARDYGKNNALIAQLKNLRLIQGVGTAIVLVELVKNLVSSPEHCNGENGSPRSGPQQLPDRVDPQNGKCTINRSHADPYLHDFLYRVDDESQLAQLRKDALLCHNLHMMEQAFADRLEQRIKEHEAITVRGSPNCQNGAVRSFEYTSGQDERPTEILYPETRDNGVFLRVTATVAPSGDSTTSIQTSHMFSPGGAPRSSTSCSKRAGGECANTPVPMPFSQWKNVPLIPSKTHDQQVAVPALKTFCMLPPALARIRPVGHRPHSIRSLKS